MQAQTEPSSLYGIRPYATKDHLCKALIKFRHAITDHIAHFDPLDNAYQGYDKLRRKAISSRFIWSDTRPTEVPVVMEHFDYTSKPSNPEDCDAWERNHDVIIMDINECVKPCVDRVDLPSIKLQIAARDLLVIIAAYSGRKLQRAERVAVSLVALAVPVYAKRRYFPIVSFFNNASPHYLAFRNVANNLVLDCIEDMQDKYGVAEVVTRFQYAVNRMELCARDIQPPGTLDKLAYDRTIEELRRLEAMLELRFKQAAARASSREEAICEVFLCAN